MLLILLLYLCDSVSLFSVPSIPLGLNIKVGGLVIPGRLNETLVLFFSIEFLFSSSNEFSEGFSMVLEQNVDALIPLSLVS